MKPEGINRFNRESCAWGHTSSWTFVGLCCCHARLQALPAPCESLLMLLFTGIYWLHFGWPQAVFFTCNDLHTRVHRDTNVRNMYIQISYLHLYTSYTLLYYINLTLSVWVLVVFYQLVSYYITICFLKLKYVSVMRIMFYYTLLNYNHIIVSPYTLLCSMSDRQSWAADRN